MLTRSVEHWVRLVQRHPVWVLLGLLALSALAFGYARTHLHLDTSTSDLFSPSLPWRQDEARMDRAFPQLSNNLVVVIDGATPALADQATVRLTRALHADPRHFSYVYAGEDMPFLRRNGLLFRSTSDIRNLTHHLTQAQPVLAQLVQNPDLPGLLTVMKRVMNHAGQADDSYAAKTTLNPLLDGMSSVFRAAATGQQQYLSWQRLFALQGADATNKPHVLIVHPALNFNATQPAQAALDALQRTTRRLELTAQHGVHIHLTGSIALQHHELVNLMRDLPLFAGLTLLLVTALLFAAMRDWRLLLGAVLTLILGLILTTGFAALAIGRLNILSIAFVMLYWGMGIDYGIHFCLSYRDARVAGLEHGTALGLTARKIGTPLIGSALTTAAAFYVFTLTRFTALSELGIIAGTGMLISLATTFTALPALLTVLKPRTAHLQRGGTWSLPAGWRFWPQRHRSFILISALGLVVVSAFTLPHLHFQVNSIKLRDPHSDAVRTFERLIKTNPRSAFSLSALAPDAQAANALKQRVKKLPEVHSAMDLTDWVPSGQTAKLSILDLWRVLVGPLVPPDWGLGHASPAEQWRAVQNFRPALRKFAGSAHGSIRSSAHALLASVNAFSSAAKDHRSQALDTLSTGLLAGLPDTLERLQQSLQAQRITLANLPKSLKQRWVSPGGLYRVSIFPSEDLMQDAALKRFVHAVDTVSPHATGTPAIMVHAASLVSHAFLEALAYTFAITLLIVWLTFRKLRDTLYTLAPLLLGGLLTCATMVLIGESFNFANVIALPLLFGAGVDYGIHIVNHSRLHGVHEQAGSSASTTKAVVYSALTTLVSFGNLAFTGHGGPASIGLVLAIGMAFILFANLIVLPALLGNNEHRTEKTSQ